MDRTNIHGNSSPVHLLPPELLDEIMVSCIPDNPRQCQPIRTLAPHSVSVVCHYWRERAISNPKLWSTICVFSARPTPRDLEWIEAWLLRSGTSLLSLYLIGLFHAYRPLLISELLSLLTKHMNRWKSFSFAPLNPYPYPIQPPTDIPLSGAGSLELAEFMISHHNELWEWFSSVLKTAPRLRELRSSRMDPNIPWHVLRKFSLSSLANASAVDCYNILTRARQLEFLDVLVSSSSALSTLPVSPSPLIHNLTELKLEAHFSVDALLDLLQLPCLQTFIFHHLGHKSETRISYNNFASFLTRSSCSLIKLELISVQFDDHEISSCLEHPAICYSLVELRVINRTLTCLPLTVANLTVPKNAGTRCLVPKLKTLEFALDPSVFSDEGILSEMVMSRVASDLDPERACRLKDVTIHIKNKNLCQIDVARLRTLPMPGLDFSLKISSNNGIELYLAI